MLPALKKEAKARQQLSHGRGKKGAGVLPDLKGEAVEHAGKVVGVIGPKSNIQPHACLIISEESAIDSIQIGAGGCRCANRHALSLDGRTLYPSYKEPVRSNLSHSARQGRPY